VRLVVPNGESAYVTIEAAFVSRSFLVWLMKTIRVFANDCELRKERLDR